MKLNKKLAGVLVGALVVGTAGVGATAAQAYGPTSQTLAGALYLSNTVAKTTPTTVNTYTDTFTLAESPASPALSVPVTVTATGASGPTVGPVDVNAGSQVVRTTVALSGSQTGSVALASGSTCNYPATAIPGDNTSTEGAWTTTGTFTTTAVGSLTATVTQIMFDDQGNLAGPPTANVCAGSGSNADYYASGSASTNAKTDIQNTNIADTFNVVTAPAAALGQAPAQALPGYARGGNQVPYTLTNIPGSTVNIALCPAANTAITAACYGSNGIAGTTTAVAITGGNGSGNFTVKSGGTGPAAGNYKLLTDSSPVAVSGNLQIMGGVTASVNGCTIPCSAQALSVGANISVTFNNFDPGSTIPLTNIGMFSGSGATAVQYNSFGLATAPVASASGTISIASYTLQASDIGATSATIANGEPGFLPGPPTGGAQFLVATVAVSVSANTCPAAGGPPVTCSTVQNITQVINPNTAGLLLAQAASAVTLPPKTVSNSAQTSNGALNQIWVEDARGGNLGWSLTAAMTNNFTDGAGHTITVPNLTVNGSNCATSLTDHTGATVGAAQNQVITPGTAQTFTAVNTAVGLCSVANAAAGQGGVATTTPSLALNIPAFQAAGTYTATIKIILTSN